MPPAFELDHVSKRYGSGHALRGVHLAGLPGQVTGLLGPNGAGKTTAIKCLAGLVRPTEGTARVGGVDARRPEARAKLGYLPERAAHFTHLTAIEALEREGRMVGVERARRRSHARELLEQVELPPDVAARRIGTYSKGERARLGIGLALVNDPAVILLDEPTDGLDPIGRRAVRRLIARFKQEGRAVLLNSHLLSEIEACCDALVMLSRGEVVRSGSLAELTAAARRWTIRLSAPLPAGVGAGLAALVDDLEQDGPVLRFALAREDALDEVVDLLRAAEAQIRDLRAETLEDAFLGWAEGS